MKNDYYNCFFLIFVIINTVDIGHLIRKLIRNDMYSNGKVNGLFTTVMMKPMMSILITVSTFSLCSFTYFIVN